MRRSRMRRHGEGQGRGEGKRSWRSEVESKRSRLVAAGVNGTQMSNSALDNLFLMPTPLPAGSAALPLTSGDRRDFDDALGTCLPAGGASS